MILHPWDKTNPGRQYVPAHRTDIRETFARIRAERDAQERARASDKLAEPLPAWLCQQAQ